MNLIAIRHARSMANEDKTIYDNIHDEDISVSISGEEYFYSKEEEIIENINSVLGIFNKNIDVYCSPYLRTVQTYELLKGLFNKHDIHVNYFELNPLLIEHTCYYFYNSIDFEKYQEELVKYGSRFYFKYKNGENGVDVYQRVVTFFNNLKLSRMYMDVPNNPVLLVTHGFTMNIIDMYINKLSPLQFDNMKFPRNCEMRKYVL